ncbi:uncharacterized protein [Venturia canescens]|uniref:uncharacterized protein n=1 Tax=Venturia canescens TaxID=32260 RepID=UPI001C9CD613|nr:uncharacterized protein LOC122412327 [Venturia canescens]
MTFALRQNESYEFYDVYNPSFKHGAKLNVTFMGTWNPERGLSIVLNQYKYLRRGNLYGLTLNSSVALDHSPENDFMTYLSTPTDPGFDTMHRFNYGLLVQLLDYYNFKLDIKRGSTWGYLLPNGSYSGILGDMAKGLVDISVTPFQYKIDRLDVVEYTVQTWIAKVCLIFRHPQKNEMSNVFLKPFEPVVWYWITVVALVNWLLLFLTVKIEQHYDWRHPVNTLDTNPASEVGLIAIAAVCQQGLSDGPRIYSGRIVFLFLFLWALLMFQFYSASVVGSLLVEKPRYITTPQDVLDSNLAVGSEDIAYNHDFFQTSDSPAIRGIYQKKMAPDKKTGKRPFFKPEEGLKKVKKGGFAFQVDTATAYKIIEETFDETEICELQEIHLFEPKHTATGVARHSPLKKMVTYGMRQIMEHGTAKRLRNIWAHRRPECPESHSSSPVPVVIEEFSPALLLLIFGCGFSLFIMFLEHLAIRYERRRSQYSEQGLKYNESYWWLIVSRKASIPKDFLSKLPLNIATEMTFALRKKDSYELFDVYNPSYAHGGKLNVTFMGTWNNKRGLNILLNQYKLNLKIGSSWGYIMPNGSFDGILGDMSKGLLDISVTPFAYKTERLSVIEYTTSRLSNAFLKPFEPVVWYWITVVMVANWIVLFSIAKIEQYYDRREPVNSLDTDPASEIGLIVIAAVCQQGLSDGPRMFSGRIIFLFLFAWSLLMYQFYSASVVGSLLVEKPRYIKTPEDVLHSDLAVGAEDIPYNRDFFETTNKRAVKEIYKTKMAPNKSDQKRPFYTAEYGLNMVKKGGFAFQIDIDTAYKIIEDTFKEDEVCELEEIYLWEDLPASIVVARHSPFKKMVTYGLRKVVEHGSAQHLKNLWAQRRPKCPEGYTTMTAAVGIEEFSPAIILLVFGCLFSLFIMLLECLRNRCEKCLARAVARLRRRRNVTKGPRRVTPCKIFYPNEFA